MTRYSRLIHGCRCFFPLLFQVCQFKIQTEGMMRFDDFHWTSFLNREQKSINPVTRVWCVHATKWGQPSNLKWNARTKKWRGAETQKQQQAKQQNIQKANEAISWCCHLSYGWLLPRDVQANPNIENANNPHENWTCSKFQDVKMKVVGKKAPTRIHFICLRQGLIHPSSCKTIIYLPSGSVSITSIVIWMEWFLSFFLDGAFEMNHD